MNIKGLFLLSILLPAAVASEADAVAISRNIQARHLPYASIMDPVFAAPDSNQIVSYSRCGDAAIWTGNYLAAEAFRYKVTTSAEALANVKGAIAGIKSLADVTGTNLLARCLVPINSPYARDITQEEGPNGIFTNPDGYYWVGNTSRDQYSGVFFGLGVAYDMVNDAGVRSSIQALVTRLLDFLRGHNWVVVMPNGAISTTFIGRADQQLSFLQVGRHVNPDRYSTAYDVDKFLLGAAVLAPVAIEVLDNNSYFKFNLDSINLYNLIRLESSSLGDVYRKAYSILRNHTRDQQNAFFNMIDRALNGADTGRDADTMAMLDAWLQRPARDPFVDLRGKLPSCNAADEACSPVPVPLRPTTDFIWQRNPFNLDGGGFGTIETAGIDYILPYWMARFYGIANGNAVVSAGNGGAVVAAESIASFFGANLAGATATADSLPLPTTLAGVSLQVQDSAGVTRPAPLFYASPTQINFEILAGTASGQARINIVNSGGSSLGSTTATVQNRAPGLFTADASGKGVAAAQSVQAQANGLQLVAPIFKCSGGACSSVPINLGVDTPTFLTLFGTGIRNRSSLSGVTVTIKGISVPVIFAGPQGLYAGLDQVNIQLPLSLRGSGESDLVVTVDGVAANTVRVNIQ